MSASQQQTERPESGFLFLVAAGFFALLCTAGHFAASALAAGLPLPGQ
jgi:hypothetical protein